MKLAFVFIIILGLLTMIVYLYWGHIVSLKDKIRNKREKKELRKKQELARAFNIVEEWKREQHETWISEYNDAAGRR